MRLQKMSKIRGGGRSLIAFLLAIAAIPTAANADALSMDIAVAGYTGTTTLTNFQALVKLCDGKGSFRYSQCAADDGSDIWFTDSDGNIIPHEIDHRQP